MANRREKSRSNDKVCFLGLQKNCRRWLQPWNEKTLALWKESYDKPRQRIKSRDMFADNGPYSQWFFHSHVWMWDLDHKEGWAPKNLSFQIVVLDKTLESPLDCKEIKLVNSKGINSEYSLEDLMLKLKLQYFGHLMWRANSLEKTLMLRKIEGQRRRGWQRMRWLESITDSIDRNLSKLWKKVKDREACHAAVHWVTKSHNLTTEQKQWHNSLYQLIRIYRVENVLLWTWNDSKQIWPEIS